MFTKDFASSNDVQRSSCAINALHNSLLPLNSSRVNKMRLLKSSRDEKDVLEEIKLCNSFTGEDDIVSFNEISSLAKASFSEGAVLPPMPNVSSCF